jgi:hypothetical protein
MRSRAGTSTKALQSYLYGRMTVSLLWFVILYGTLYRPQLVDDRVAQFIAGLVEGNALESAIERT